MCYCEPGYSGVSCEQVAKCPVFNGKECSSNGLCKYGRCFCKPGYDQYDDCRTPDTCTRGGGEDAICSGHGVCDPVKGTCFSEDGHFGKACERGHDCDGSGCSSHGYCDARSGK